MTITSTHHQVVRHVWIFFPVKIMPIHASFWPLSWWRPWVKCLSRLRPPWGREHILPAPVLSTTPLTAKIGHRLANIPRHDRRLVTQNTHTWHRLWPSEPRAAGPGDRRHPPKKGKWTNICPTRRHQTRLAQLIWFGCATFHPIRWELQPVLPLFGGWWTQKWVPALPATPFQGRVDFPVWLDKAFESLRVRQQNRFTATFKTSQVNPSRLRKEKSLEISHVARGGKMLNFPGR